MLSGAWQIQALGTRPTVPDPGRHQRLGSHGEGGRALWGGGERRTRAEPGRQKSLLRREDVDSWERGLRGERHPGAGL